MIDGSHVIDRNRSFKNFIVFLLVFLLGIRSRLLHMAEAMVNKTYNPNLYIHEELFNTFIFSLAESANDGRIRFHTFEHHIM